MIGDRPKRITAKHLLLLAIVYLRESSERQAEENVGSTAHQRSQAECRPMHAMWVYGIGPLGRGTVPRTVTRAQ